MAKAKMTGRVEEARPSTSSRLYVDTVQKLKFLADLDNLTIADVIDRMVQADLRHTCATLLLTANVHPKVVQMRLGHASIKVTLDTYSHLIPTMQTSAVEALDRVMPP